MFSTSPYSAADTSSAGGIKPKYLAWINILEEPISDEQEPVWNQEGDTATVELVFGGFEVRTLLVEL